MVKINKLITDFYELKVNQLMDKRIWDLPIIDKNEDIYVWTNPNFLHEDFEKKYKIKLKWKKTFDGEFIKMGGKGESLRLTNKQKEKLAKMFSISKSKVTA